MKLFVRQIGGDAFPRYAIQCENATWWTGERWSPAEEEALRFASLAAVRDTWKVLRKEMRSTAKQVTRLECPIRVTVNKKLTPEQVTDLAWFLSRASQFFLDYTISRPEGLQDACISSQIVWASLRESDQ